MIARVRLPLLVVVAYAVLGLAWAIASAPFSAPDETQHYIRALGIRTDARLAGPRVAYTGPVRTADGRWVAPDPSIEDTPGTIWRRKLTRGATVPGGLSPAGFDCMTPSPNLTAACAERITPSPVERLVDTDVGSYPPFPYLLPAAATALGDTPAAANRWGRLAVLLLWIVLLASAVWSLWDRAAGGVSLAGLVVALTPVAVFIGGSLNNSAAEIAAAVAFFAALLRLARGEEWRLASAWTVAAASGAILVLSRSLGALWLLCGVAVAVTLIRPGRALEIARTAGRKAALAVAAIATALALAVVWERAYGPRGEVSLLPSASALRDGVSQVRGSFESVIGGFGHGEVALSGAATTAWILMAAFLVGAALRVGRGSERRALVVALVLAVAVPVYVYAAFMRNEGIETQGRHLLPLMAMVPLTAGEVLRRRIAGREWRRSLFAAVVAVAAAVQLLAWWTNSRRYAVGADGPWWFIGSAEWEAPGGWALWAALVVLTGLMALAGAARTLLQR